MLLAVGFSVCLDWSRRDVSSGMEGGWKRNVLRGVNSYPAFVHEMQVVGQRAKSSYSPVQIVEMTCRLCLTTRYVRDVSHSLKQILR